MTPPAPGTFAVLGQGSIGRRHAGLLRELGHWVVTFDPIADADTRDERAALEAADAAVVASPTSEHLDQARRAVAAGCHVLVEKPLSTAAAGVDALLAEATAGGRLLAVAMNLRFHPGPRGVRDAIAAGEIGRPLTAAVSFGSYLPDWRPEADYRRSYSARSELGGGVLLDVVHELDYATWALGEVVEVSAWLERVSDLEIDVEDVALLHLRHASGALSSVQLDYLDRSYRRGCRVVGSEGTVSWDWGEEAVTVLRPGREPERRPAPSDVQAAYRAQAAAFAAAVGGGGGGLVSGEEGLAALRVIDAARESSATRRAVTLG
jgi:predicted dehydrogenase